MDKSVQGVNYSVIDNLLPLAQISTNPFHGSASYGASHEIF